MRILETRSEVKTTHRETVYVIWDSLNLIILDYSEYARTATKNK